MWVAILALFFFSFLAPAQESSSPILPQMPVVNANVIVFEYAGDLWSVSRSGGSARRLTSGPGREGSPRFSPDGTMIAFTGEYDGNVDVFTVATMGGVPKRLTWHPSADVALGWTPDGRKIVFSSARMSYTFVNQLYTTNLDEGFPEQIPLPMGYEASYSPDGSRLAYVPVARAFYAWKRYRGGRTTPIWLANLADSAVEKVPRENSNDICPMWVGDRVYFLSDRNGAMTLFSYDTKSKQVREELKNTGLDYKSASAGPGAIVLERFGQVELFDLKSRKAQPVKITIEADLPEVRESRINVSKRLVSARLSPTGARALFEANGEILTVPAEKGDARNLTGTPGVMERNPAWSPDGKTIAYFSDESGEYALHLKPQSGEGDARKIALPEPGFYRGLHWSPDSKKVSFIDARMRIWYLEVDSRKATQIDKERYYSLSNSFAPTWSPDSRYLAYVKRLENYLGAVHVYALSDNKVHQVTDGLSDAASPVFDANGKYLYFAASTDSGPARQPDVGSFSRSVTASLYAVVLSKDEPSPFSPESDEEKAADEKKPATPAKSDEVKPEPAKPDAPKPEAAKPPAKVPDVKIDFENIGQRVIAMPMPPRRYVNLQAGKAGVLYAVSVPAPVPGPPPGATIHRYTMTSRKADTPLSGVQAFEISTNGEKMLYRQGDNWFLKNVPPAPPPGNAPAPPPPPPAPGGASGQLQTANLEVRHVPRESWKQMYREAWRVQREHFYDPGYHGLDLAKAEKTYEPFLANIASRNDLNYLFAEMMGNMVVGHLFVAGGQQPEVKRVQSGLLGCDFTIENGRYRFARVFNGENWNPDLRAPLTQPGVNVAAGEYLLAVNGRNVTASDNVYSFFEGTANKQVRVRVGGDPSGTGARDVTVVPVPSETRLRNLAWIEDNRRKVEQMTKGRVAYVYLPDTAFGGLSSFNRYFYAQVGKQAAVIDERFNGGGLLATDIVEQLNRKLMSSVATRDGADEVQPQGGIFGPKVMLVNEFAGSGGDAMPWYFRRAGAGKLIGKRTWGGLVGRAGAPQLMDGGFVSSPSSAVWDTTESQWIAENTGVAPDIEVELDPAIWRKGRDPQLEKAVEIVLQELEKNPPPTLKRPQFPKYQTLPGAAQR